MTGSAHFNWSSAARTDVGVVRQLNEDSYLENPTKGLWAVADGMGGHAVGDLASRVVIDSLRDISTPSSLGKFVEQARRCLQKANQRLREEASNRQQGIIGSTVAVLLAYGRHCVCLWAGDSRIYLYRDMQLMQLSRDHSQVEELVARGLLSREEADSHPAANAITRAVGAADGLELDDQMVQVKDGDIFLLCSDGLNNEVTDSEIAAALLHGDCKRAVNNLISLTLDRGARDNITVVVVRADDQLESDKTLVNPTLLAKTKLSS